ncbi:hypothetical protein AAY473_008639, partial [Plecturocebus cupreus]
MPGTLSITKLCDRCKRNSPTTKITPVELPKNQMLRSKAYQFGGEKPCGLSSNREGQGNRCEEKDGNKLGVHGQDSNLLWEEEPQPRALFQSYEESLGSTSSAHPASLVKLRDMADNILHGKTERMKTFKMIYFRLMNIRKIQIIQWAEWEAKLRVLLIQHLIPNLQETLLPYSECKLSSINAKPIKMVVMRLGSMAHASLWEADVGRSRGQEFKISLANMPSRLLQYELRHAHLR